MIHTLFLFMPEANHTGVQRDLALRPPRLNTLHPGNVLIRPGRRRFPLVGSLSQWDRLLGGEHIGFERGAHINPALALQIGACCPVEKATILEPQIACAQHRCLLQQGTTQGDIVHLDRRQGHLRQETGTIEQRP